MPLMAHSDAVLWDLIIDVTVENNGLFQGESPIISGVVTDHAGKPVADAKIHVRAGQDSIFLSTDETGQFRVVLEEFNRIPGNYIVNVKGISPDGKTGIASVEFQVKGNLHPYSASEQLLSTPEAQKYLNMDPESIKGDAIATKLYDYYQNIHQEYLREKKVAEELTEEQLFIKEQKRLAKEALQKVIEEKKPGPGTYSGYKYDMFVENLDPSVKDIIENQLNYTKNTFAEAQQAMDEILNNGGTYEEAREAYLSKLSTTRNFIESMTTNQTAIDAKTITNANQTEPTILNETESNQTESIQTKAENKTTSTESEVEQFSLQTLMGLADIKITTQGNSIFVDVNGTTIEFAINGTEITQVTR